MADVATEKAGQTSGRATDSRDDFAAWARGQAACLRAGRFADLDIEAVAEEIEDLGRRQRDALESRLAVLLLHLLKWEFQPGARSTSWSGSIREQRRAIAILLKKYSSLRSVMVDSIEDAYPQAVLRAERETGFPEASFPTQPPYGVSELLDPAFWPGTANDR